MESYEIIIIIITLSTLIVALISMIFVAISFCHEKKEKRSVFKIECKADIREKEGIEYPYILIEVFNPNSEKIKEVKKICAVSKEATFNFPHIRKASRQLKPRRVFKTEIYARNLIVKNRIPKDWVIHVQDELDKNYNASLGKLLKGAKVDNGKLLLWGKCFK